YYLSLAEAAEEQLRGPEQAAWLERLDRELLNLRAAFEFSVASSQLSVPGPNLPQLTTDNWQLATAVRLAGALWRFWSTRGHAREGLEALRGALARATSEHPSLGRSAWRAKALTGAGALAHDLGDYAAARAYHEESLGLYQLLEDPTGKAGSANNLGNLAFDQGDHERAGELYRQALALYEEAGETSGAARVLSNLGALAQEQGELEQAARLLEQSLRRRRTLDDPFGLAISLENVGNLEGERGNAARAVQLYEEALA